MENKPGRGRGRGRPSGQGFRGGARGARGAGLISCGPQPRQSVPSTARTINTRNSEALIDWMTQNTSSSSSASARYPDLTPSFLDSGTPQVDVLTSQSAAAAAATTTSSRRDAPLDLSEELFEHDITADAQELLPLVEDEGAKIDSTPHMSHLHVNTAMDVMFEEDFDEVPGVAAVLEVSDTSEAVDDDEAMDVTWQLTRRRDERGGSSEEEEEEETECARRRRRKRQIDGSSRGSSSQKKRGTGTARPHVAPRVSQQTCPSTPAVDTPRMPASKISAVWHFFCLCASDSSKAICNLCKKKLSRGKVSGHLGTTVLKNHLLKKHEHQWNEHVRRSSTLTQSHTTPPPPPTPVPGPPPASSTCTSFAPSQPPSSTLPLTFSSSCSSAHSQPSVVEMFQRKKPMSPSNPLAQRLTAGLAELLARQLLPYQLVDSEAFRKFVAIGTPQWKIPGRNYFSKKAIPKLYKEVERQVVSSMSHSVGARVHLTTDGWSAKHGQGRYMTYTAHWVNLLATTGKHGVRACTVEMVAPPRLAGRSAADTSSSPPPPTSSSQYTSSDSYSDTAAAVSSLTAHPQLPRAYSACKAQRCHAVLDMDCLPDESHTGPALLAALQEQVKQWLTKQQLEIGRVVCDNGSNLLSALSLGKLTHVPCMAHVLNLIVQRFVSKFPGLQDVLKQSRKLCAHLRRSYVAMERFADIQRQKKLPVRRLICDSPTRWNSTLLMFDRLLQQERAVNYYLYNYASKKGPVELGFVYANKWALMRNACRLMRPFEEVTNLVSRSEGSISDLIPYVFLLERAVRRVVDQAVEEREEEEQELWAPSPPNTDLTTPALLDATQRDEEVEEAWEEDSEEEDGFEEEIGEEPQQSTQGACAAPLLGTRRGIVRGWGEEENLTDITEAEEEAMAGSTSTLVQMGSFMLSSLLRDPRIKRLKENDLYWVATLLDPRYKHKVAEMLPHSQKAEKMGKFQKTLSTMLYNAFKGDATAQDRGVSNPPPPPPFSTQARTGSSSSDMMVTSDMQAFFNPTTRLGPSGSTLRQRLDRQVADYLALSADIDSLSGSDEPLDYWVRRLDLWPELSQYAMELLACPASSVLSERTFSAAGGIVTEKRSRLSKQSVKYLTFIKMNEEWIPKGYSLPKED